jgi:hypothetical protein
MIERVGDRDGEAACAADVTLGFAQNRGWGRLTLALTVNAAQGL